MPTYGYECNDCGDQFEIVQSVKDNALVTCEKCAGSLRKRIYPVGIAFKGSGFYVNDYAARKPDAATDAGSGTKPAASAEKSATADSKTDLATTPKADVKTQTKADTKVPVAAAP